MFRPRNALVLAAIFVAVAVLYWFGWYTFEPAATDYAGFLMLTMLGVAMAFGFLVLLRNSREL
jgi:hypothetical protein